MVTAEITEGCKDRKLPFTIPNEKEEFTDNEGSSTNSQQQQTNDKRLDWEECASLVRSNSNTHILNIDEFKAKLEHLSSEIDGCYKKIFEKLPKNEIATS